MHRSLEDEILRLHSQICAGLADPTRILLLYALREGPTSVGALAEELGLPQPTVSRHLKVLRERGLVVARREGANVFYTVADDRVLQALDTLRAVLADLLARRASLAEALEGTAPREE